MSYGVKTDGFWDHIVS